MQQRRRIFSRIEKLQRCAADQIPPARRTQRINPCLRTADSNRTGRNFFARYVAARRRQIPRQPCQKCKTRNEANARDAVLAGAVKIDDFGPGKFCVFSYAIQVEPKFCIITDRNFDQTRSIRCGPTWMTPGSRNNGAPDSCRKLVENAIRCAIRLENGDRIEENSNAGVSRCKFNDAGNRCALKQLKYSEHFIQCFFRRIFKLLADAHDECRISEGNNFHQLSVMLSDSVAANAKHEARLSNISVLSACFRWSNKMITDSSLHANANSGYRSNYERRELTLPASLQSQYLSPLSG